MVTSTGRTLCIGFFRRKVIQALPQLKPWMIDPAELLPVGARLPWERVFDGLPFGRDGLFPAVVQQYDTGEVLMLAWMNRAALPETLATGHECYWSRQWRKGETSGHAQHLREMRLGCDGDALLLLVEQTGPACHSGRASCFYNAVCGDRVLVISSALQRSGHD
jgi:phosphoribosyl-AMP cyclohydrolase